MEKPNPNRDKIGNLIIYLVDEVGKRHQLPLFLTKLLKLFFIIDEAAIKETGAPVTGLEYRVWKTGPVAFDIYQNFMAKNSETFSFFAEAKKNPEGYDVLISPVNKFDDSEFSDYEMELIDRVIDRYGNYTEDEQVNLLRDEGSLWKKIVDEKKLEELFKKENSSSIKIDLSQLIQTDPHKLEIFNTAQDSLGL